MRVAVVGAGIGGLVCALDLQESGAEVVVLEGSDRVGGKLLVGEVGDITVDLGAESMLARRPEALDLVESLGWSDRLVHPQPAPARIWTRGALRALPPTVMGVPADLDALQASGILQEPLRPQRVPMPAADLSVGAFVAERAGREVVERLVEPLLGGVYAGHADRLSLHAAAPMIAALGEDPVSAAVQRRQGSAAGDAPMLAGLVGGLGTLPPALAEQLDVRLRSTVRALNRENGGWTLVVGPTNDARRERFDAVVLATPAPAASRLLAETAPRAAFALAGIDYASMALVTLVLDGADLPSGSGFLVPPVEGTAIKAATFATGKWAWLAQAAGEAAVVRASLGRAGDTAMLQYRDEELVAAATADLRRVVEPAGRLGRTRAWRVQRWGGGLPQYEVGHRKVVADIEADIAAVPGVELCGAVYHGVGIPAVIATARAAADRIRGQETMAS